MTRSRLAASNGKASKWQRSDGGGTTRTRAPSPSAPASFAAPDPSSRDPGRNFVLARGLDRKPAMRHPVGAQRVELRQAELQRVEAEQIGHGMVEMALFPREQVLPRGGFQPLGQLYDRAFSS